MQRFVNTVEQLDAAVRFITIGSVAYSRMALLLLDNAAEVLIARAARDELMEDEGSSGWYGRVHGELSPDERKQFAIDFGRRLLTKRERREVEFDFDAKANYLVERGHLEPGIAAVLSGLHRHRNDTYHRDRTRVPILRATAILYLELCCELLLQLGRSGAFYFAGEDDWSDFMTKYGLKGKYFMMDDAAVEGLVTRFRQEVGIEGHELAGSLAAYLSSRVEAVEEQLDFLDYFPNHDEALRTIQFNAKHGDDWNQKLAKQGPPAWKGYEAAKAKFTPSVTSATLEEWKTSCNAHAA